MVDVCYPSGTDWTCYGTEEEVDEIDPAVRERSEALAWSTLAALTGYRLSLCPTVLRPCRAGCSSQTWFVAPTTSGAWQGAAPGSVFQPYISNGQWYNGCGCNRDDCSCTTLCEVIMPTAVGGIVEVWLDGALLDESAYRVDNGNRLVRTDGECWPACQDMTQPSDGDEAFSVTYYPGLAPNDLFRYAAGVLAAEFTKACSGGKCRLPAGVTNVARNGVSFEIAAGLFASGYTGIREVDAILAVYNPFGLKAPSRVMSPDQRRGRTTTWSA